MKNIPNILTVSRVFLAVGFIVLMQMDSSLAVYWATALFVFGALTDLMDGYLARKYHLSTDFGKIMDPIADKFLILSAFFVFMRLGYVAGWMFFAIAAREVLVTASRLALMRKGKVIAAEQAGKIKTVSQMITIFVLLIIRVLVSLASDPSSWVFQQSTMAFFFVTTQLLMVITVTITLYSGISYLRNNRSQLF